MRRPFLVPLVLISGGALARAMSTAAVEADRPFSLVLRTRVEGPVPGGAFRVVEKPADWDPKRTAVIVCDMWDLHHCLNAVRRVNEMAPRMDRVLREARDRGAIIIHAPSDCIGQYESHPARRRAQAVPRSRSLPADIGNWCYKIPNEEKGTYPIDQADGGEDDDPAEHARWAARLAAMGRNPAAPWKSQTDKLAIDPEADYLSTDGAEVWSILEARGVDNVILLGVHTNMCVLGRPFGLRQMAKNGKNVALMRDMTDTMYNPKRAPYVSHFTGSDLIFEHVEKFVCPTITSDQLIGGRPFRFRDDRRPHAAFLIAEDEYRTDATLPAFATRNLARDFRLSYVFAARDNPDDLPGLAMLDEADLAVVSMRRRVLPKMQTEAIRRFVASGKAVIGLRTASHAFSPRNGEAVAGDREAWTDFDPEVLGGHYRGHHGNGGTAAVAMAPEAMNHPITSGFDAAKIVGHGSLYQVNPLAKSATPLLVGSIPDRPSEPVAWTNLTAAGGRVFYTSLGHPDDFRDPEFNRLLRNAAYWAAGLPVPASAALSEPIPPVPSTAFVTPRGLRVDRVLSEPIVRQPVSLSFDEKGRMWVVQYLQYPDPAGLKMLSRDGVWRAVYDKVPAAPPNHVKGADKVTIHEDTDGDGVYDRHKTFVEGLNIATAVARGRGGVFVLNPPYLLFYPDRDGDDVPDGDPTVCLEGFGLEDTHSVVNSLCWGPDGWLYAAQGSTVTARVRRPDAKEEAVASMGQLIWRYHPESRRYEVFAEGGGNAFGVEIDSKGRVYSGHNGGDTRGFHYVQGGYFQKGFSKHGPLSNSYAFGYFPAMKHPKAARFTHAFAIYEGETLPYPGVLFGVDPLNHRVVMSEVARDGSTFRTTDVGDAIATADPDFRPVDIKLGPDGALYVADWHDRQVNHYRNHEGQIDKADGRIERLGPTDGKPSRNEDLSKRSGDGLVDLLSHPNKWRRQTALRLLGDRKDRSLVPRLAAMVRGEKGPLALEALWALNLCGGFDEAIARECLGHANPFVRLWSVRLACDDGEVSSELAARVADRARDEPDVEVRSQMACSARRLAAEPCLAIVRSLLARDEDAADPHMPLLLWWAIESKAASDRGAILGQLRDPKVWGLPLVKGHIVGRLMRRYAATGSRADLATCEALLQLAPDEDSGRRLIAGFELAIEGQELPEMPEGLVAAMTRFGGNSGPIALRRGQPEAVEQAIALLADDKADKTQQLRTIQALGQLSRPSCRDALLRIVSDSSDPALRSAALRGLVRHNAPEVSAKVLAAMPEMTEDLRADAIALLAGRASWAVALLEAIDARAIDPKGVPAASVASLRLHRDPRVIALVRKHWGEPKAATSAERKARIEGLAAQVRGGTGVPKPGKALFAERCARCHILFGQGGKVGPDLTSYKRDDLDTMLLSVVSPDAEIREGYANHFIATAGGLTLAGTIVEQDANRVVLRTADDREVSVPRSEIDVMEPRSTSIMPDGLLDDLDAQQVRDLFAYLRSTQPLID